MSIAPIQSGQEIRALDREAWLAMRSSGIGASEAAAICGASPYESPLDIYLRKVGLADPVVETMAMKLGTMLEPVVMELYEDEARTSIGRRQVFARSASHPFLFATLDGITDEGRIVECKTIGSRLSGQLGEEDSDQVPDQWLIQAHHQAFVAETAGIPNVDWSRVEFAVLVGGQEFRRFMVEIDEALIAHMLLKLGDFWDRVLTRIPPDVSRPSDAGLMHLVYRDEGPAIEGDMELLDLVMAYGNSGVLAKQAEDARAFVKAQILERMGDASAALLPDGSRVSRKVIRVEEKAIVRKASVYSQIYISKPKKGR